MIFKILFQQKWTIFILFVTPVLFIVASYLFMDRTTEELKVPVVLVDSFSQEITDEIMSDMTTEDSFQVIKEDSIPKDLLERGEVEAVFVLPKHLEEKIYSGELDDVIEWYRHDRSLFDGLFKEQLASAIVTKAVRAESANLVQRYNDDASWDDMFEYGLRYLEPEPIFQIQFESLQQQAQIKENDSDDWLLFRWLYWIFIWSIIAFLTQLLLTWREQNIFERLGTIGQTNQLRYSWFLTFMVILSVTTLITSFSIQQLWLSSYDWYTILIDLGLVIGSLVIYFLLSFLIRKRETLWAFSLTYGVTSSVIFFLIYFNLLTYSYWFSAFVPVWILI